MEKTKIIIIHETAIQSWMRDASTFALFIALIGVGVILESSAMQWVGAIIAFITTASHMSGAHKKASKTIAEARTFLDDLESNNETTT